MPRGQLILIEGLDRSGKSTQAQLISSKLPSCHLYKFPNRQTPIGLIIKQYLEDKQFQLSDESAHLLFSANRWEFATEIINLLNQGCFIVLDRYIYSGIAYTLAKTDPQLSNVTLANYDWLIGPDRGLPKPDLTIFLSLDIEEISQRKGWGDERYELKQFQTKVKSSFMKVLNCDNDPSVSIIDVDKLSIDQVNQKLMALIVSKGKNILIDEEIKLI